MKDLKIKLQKILTISEKPLLFLLGLGALWASEVKVSAQDMQFIARAFGITALAFGVLPMFASFVKEIWNKR